MRKYIESIEQVEKEDYNYSPETISEEVNFTDTETEEEIEIEVEEEEEIEVEEKSKGNSKGKSSVTTSKVKTGNMIKVKKLVKTGKTITSREFKTADITSAKSKVIAKEDSSKTYKRRIHICNHEEGLPCTVEEIK